jgi:C-terminal processing protease CtpA/Prc
MPTWVLYETKRDWHADIDAIVAGLNTRHVRLWIIDLRDNGGGSDVGNDLLAHMTQQPLNFSGYRQLLRYRRVPDNLRPYLHTWDSAFFDWGTLAGDFDGRFYFRQSPPGENADTVMPRAPRFEGRVVVLVGPTNSSATFEFASRVKASGLATLVGSTTGGNQRGINGGAFFFLRLPNSGIELDVPLVGQFPRGPQPDAGIAPDVAVHLTREDVAEGRDPVMEAALKL